MKSFIVPLILFAFVRAASAAWGVGGCATVVAPAPRYEWAPGRDPDQLHLCRDGRQVGTYRRSERLYYPFDGETWSAPAEPPTPLPPEETSTVAAPAAEENFGIDREKWAREPRRSIAARGLPDDRGKARLTVIGSEEERKTVLNDLDAAPDLKPLRESLVVQAYAPDHWAVARTGFKTDGRPSIYLQSPDGKVLHRQDDYQGGPRRLAEAIRKASPNYDPRKDPDLTRPRAPDVAAPESWPGWLWGALGVAGLWLLRRLQVNLRSLPDRLLDRLADAVVRRLPPPAERKEESP